jgi:hypothetical protein
MEEHFEGKSPRGKFTTAVLLLHNAPAHQALATKQKLVYLGYSVLNTHPTLQIWPHRNTTYSLD